jgi:tetratricopeptide (TPR) repeat protein
MRRFWFWFSGLLILTLGLLAGCTARSSVSSVVKGFFSEVNKSNFESAKVQYLSTVLINTLDTPGGSSHKTIQASFEKMIGHINSVDARGVEVKGESATATAHLTGPCGSVWHCRVELVKEGGREWKISDWDAPELVGQKAWDLMDKNPKAATNEFQADLAGNPRDAWEVFGLGLCYLKTGDAAAAEEKFSESLRLCPDMCFSEYSELALFYWAQKNWAAQEANLQKAIGCDLSHAPQEAAKKSRGFAYYQLAEAYLEDSKFDQAIDSAQKALALVSKDEWFTASAWNTLGWAYYKKGDRSQALKYLKLAVENAPNSVVFRQHYSEASR